MDLVIVKGIEKAYESKPVLKNINLSIREGEFFTLLGPSGCGKTTLLRIIAGFVNPDQGQVIFEDEDMTQVSPENRNVGMVFQNYALFPFMNVFDNVAYGLKVKRMKKTDIKEKVKHYLQLVNLSGYEDRNVSDLSGGEQQRVALARALVVEPRVLLLDEPLSNLDARLRDKMRTELKEIQRKLKVTCVFVTHDQKEAMTMSDRIAIFNEGQCMQLGTPKEIYANPMNTFVATFVGDTNLFEAKVEEKKAVLSASITLNLRSDKKGDYISVRPQDIVMSRHQSQSENSFEGLIHKISLSGDLEEYDLTIAELELKVMKLNTLVDEEDFREGDRVWVAIHPKVIHILEQ
jgi:spermidine/putrescine ABC transporter ATP-binding subunit